MFLTLCFSVFLFSGDPAPVWRHCYKASSDSVANGIDVCLRTPDICEWLTCSGGKCGERREELEWTLTGRRDP